MQEKTGYFLNVVAHKLEPRSFYRGHMIQIYSQEAGTNVRVCGVCALVCMCMCVYIYVCVCSHGLVQRLASSNSRSPPPRGALTALFDFWGCEGQGRLFR